METTVKKEDLLAILRENRDKHRTVFLAALDGYRAQALKTLEENIQWLSEGRSPKIYIMLTRPEDHTRDYERVIKMLEMEIGDTFVLSEDRFAQYVMDDWRWKRDWLKMSNSYAAASTQEAYGVVEEDE